MILDSRLACHLPSPESRLPSYISSPATRCLFQRALSTQSEATLSKFRSNVVQGTRTVVIVPLCYGSQFGARISVDTIDLLPLSVIFRSDLTKITEKVCIITADGRTLTGTLLSADQSTNIVLTSTVERVIRPRDDPEPSAEVEHGLYLIRGDNVVVCGLLDEALDDSIDWTEVRGDVIGGTKHI